MSPKAVSAVVALCLAVPLTLPSVASAAEHTILSGESFSVEVELESFDILSYTWSSDEPLAFTLSGPMNADYVDESDDTYGTGSIPLLLIGTYTLTWSNSGSSTAHLSFTLSVPFEEAERAMSVVLYVGLMVFVVVLVTLVIVVVHVVMKERKRKAQPPPVPPPMAAEALATGHCPSCGVPIDKNGSFCGHCGAKFR